MASKRLQGFLACFIFGGPMLHLLFRSAFWIAGVVVWCHVTIGMDNVLLTVPFANIRGSMRMRQRVSSVRYGLHGKVLD